MSTQIQIRRGTAAQWSAANPVLAVAEQGLETDTRKTKFGDGVTAWSGLAYSGSGGEGATNLSVTLSAGNIIVHSDTGTDATIPAADDMDAGLMVPAQFEKLAEISGSNTGDETVTTVGALINGADAKATPVNADMLILLDSAAANAVKKLSWADLTASLKTYFDTVYAAIPVVVYSPLDEFTGGENGAWYDPSDFSSLSQDVAGTVPVTAVGQTVRRINDKSGNGHHATSAVGCLLGVDGVNYYLGINGAYPFTTETFAFGSSAFTMWAGVFLTGGTVVSFGNIGTQAGTFDFGAYNGGGLLYRNGSAIAFGARNAASQPFLPDVYSMTCDLSGATHATENPDLRYAQTQPALANFGTADTGTGPFGNYPLVIGAGQGPFSARLYQLIIVNAIKPLGQGEVFVNRKAANPDYFQAMNFADTGVQTNVNNVYQDTSAFAHVDFQTTATSCTVASYATLGGNYGEIGVFIDDIWNQQILRPTTGSALHTITLPAGNKKVSFVNGLKQQGLGTFVTKVSGNAAMTAIAAVPTNRVLIYGDSIAVGGNSDIPTRDAAAMIVRAAYAPNSLAFEAFGFRALNTDCPDAGNRATFVAKIQAYAPARLYIEIGTNDYGLNLWSAASFGTAYAALLDDLHTALPAMTIFCQTPTIRTAETANSFGNTLGDYRSQISTAVSTRTGFATLVNGYTILTTGDLDDAVHPSTAGHVKIAAAERAVLGI